MEEAVIKLLSSDLLLLAGAMLGTLIIKDIVSNIASGLMFVLNKDFNVGDSVVLDGKEARIISIGIRQTIFEIGDCWVYVHNDRVKYLQLGKRK